jgi:hypothetical protein
LLALVIDRAALIIFQGDEPFRLAHVPDGDSMGRAGVSVFIDGNLGPRDHLAL